MQYGGGEGPRKKKVGWKVVREMSRVMVESITYEKKMHKNTRFS